MPSITGPFSSPTNPLKQRDCGFRNRDGRTYLRHSHFSALLSLSGCRCVTITNCTTGRTAIPLPILARNKLSGAYWTDGRIDPYRGACVSRMRLIRVLCCHIGPRREYSTLEVPTTIPRHNQFTHLVVPPTPVPNLIRANANIAGTLGGYNVGHRVTFGPHRSSLDSHSLSRYACRSSSHF